MCILIAYFCAKSLSKEYVHQERKSSFINITLLNQNIIKLHSWCFLVMTSRKNKYYSKWVTHVRKGIITRKIRLSDTIKLSYNSRCLVWYLFFISTISNKTNIKQPARMLGLWYKNITVWIINKCQVNPGEMWKYVFY